MGEVTSLFARKMVAVAGEAIDARDVLNSVGLDPDGPWDPSVMLDEAVYYDMLELMATQMGDATTSLPLRVGDTMRPDEYGALGLAWKAAPNLLGSFSRVARYARLWTSIVQYEVRDTDQGVLFIEDRKGARRLGMRLSIEADLASGVSLGRQVTDSSFAPRAVHFMHPSPQTVRHHEAFFGCPVYFGSDMDAMLLSKESLLRPNLLGDPGITQFLVSHLDQELAEIKDEDTLEDKTKNAIARALSEGFPKVDDVARGLGLSVRSFHRRLSENGVSFRALTEDTQREIAVGMLRDHRYSLSEIAFMTGFSEQSAFSRAFKRWTGKTPATYRKHGPNG
ncbi:AraC family transcriptional regulator [Boseongicola aestuarii]|uniref:HTH-type transcriptional regulator VirS n=1 Tax=Boseongicola aestuarii TaxID=1470561 RepID=A0A238IX23_9RHOB|nr:AraC family transcriptional regulator [Boseongicola aestuarii]SMX22532.1 HTH-type transcriptional regulator VirS [Boseongicola aestuarii]